ncbi:hypothetical protein EDM52_20695 [Brevibacillus invocatus]|uniref:Uncharacterized protein n=1 Tax=Brevibacillus invocatus TaxID=173959 RepID=A0A3M8BY03_9BACL|nr:hypothetical protein EDM52_20695 [Brevibacillus invocatus]
MSLLRGILVHIIQEKRGFPYFWMCVCPFGLVVWGKSGCLAAHALLFLLFKFVAILLPYDTMVMNDFTRMVWKGLSQP